MQWWYAKGGQSVGPVDDAALKRLFEAGTIRPDDLVWNETMGPQWVKASGVMASTPTVSPVAPPPPLPARPPVLPGRISCVDPVDRAWDRTKQTLFNPFRLKFWFALGVSAWLATLGEMGGAGLPAGNADFSGLSNLDSSHTTEVDELPETPLPAGEDAGTEPGAVDEGGQTTGSDWLADARADFRQAADFVRQHADVFALLLAVLVALGIALGVVIIWIRSRGKFMLLDNLVRLRSEVSAPWHAFARHGNSLFAWTFVFNLVILAVTVVMLGLIFLLGVLPCIRARALVPGIIPIVLLIGLVWMVVGVVAGYVARFLEDFIIPIMYRHGVTAREAWTRFGPLVRRHFWQLVLYGLFHMVLNWGAGLLMVLLIVLTCCIAGCLLMIPYVAAVVVLPVTVFFRFYSVEYLAQFGPDYHVRATPPEAS